jgi:hypothetical protein
MAIEFIAAFVSPGVAKPLRSTEATPVIHTPDLTCHSYSPLDSPSPNL